MSISRERLSADVHSELIAEIIRGEFAPGQRLKDAELAERLGVSRTPVREALLRLEREGFISAQKHLGFSVKALEESEISEVYPLVKLLECSALERCPLPAADKVFELRELAGELGRAGEDPLERIERDSAWHRALIEESGNRHLLRILADLKKILFRYEYTFMQVAEHVADSACEHSGIVEALAAGDRRKAVKLLGAHWDRCTETTLEDFREQLKAEAASPALSGARA